MALNFPDSPALNEEYAAQGRTWTWNGTVWLANETSVDQISATSPLAYDQNTNNLTVDLSSYSTTQAVSDNYIMSLMNAI